MLWLTLLLVGQAQVCMSWRLAVEKLLRAWLIAIVWALGPQSECPTDLQGLN